MAKSKFFFTLLTVIVYEVLTRLMNPDGLSLLKLVITLLLWISFFLSFSTFIIEYRAIKQILPSLAFYVFIAIITWNIINILRSVISHDGTVTTLFGNPETSLALLVPFSLSFSIDIFNIIKINKFYLSFIIIGVAAYFVFFVITNGSDNFTYNKVFEFILYNTFFLISIIPYQSTKNKIIIVIGSIVLYYVAIVTGYRIINIRIVLLYLSVIAVYLYQRYNVKLILIAAVLFLTIPFFLLVVSVRTGESAFIKYRPESSNEDFIDDTRTFLYTEVFDDLKKNNDLIIGKGSNGSYYSPYFDEYGGDTANRLSVEVGILAMMLKGGIIAVLLNLTILFVAIYLSLFRTNNYFVMSLGFMLIIHTIILFITNYLDYSSYNVVLWFFIGVCLSKQIRSLNNIEIKNFLLYGYNLS